MKFDDIKMQFYGIRMMFFDIRIEFYEVRIMFDDDAITLVQCPAKILRERKKNWLASVPEEKYTAYLNFIFCNSKAVCCNELYGVAGYRFDRRAVRLQGLWEGIGVALQCAMAET